MPFTEAALKHLANLAEQGVTAPDKLRKDKTTTKRTPKPKKPVAKKAK
ncbi:MAG: hypothetical protein V2J13_10670 [Cycloclasticus sp.]|jgi:hypothetical protein|nr:hypothetical protein [Cycloclasticus sp.]